MFWHENSLYQVCVLQMQHRVNSRLTFMYSLCITYSWQKVNWTVVHLLCIIHTLEMKLCMYVCIVIESRVAGIYAWIVLTPFPSSFQISSQFRQSWQLMKLTKQPSIQRKVCTTTLATKMSWPLHTFVAFLNVQLPSSFEHRHCPNLGAL